MEYEEFINNYSKELQILDMIDMLKNCDPDVIPALDRLVTGSKAGKNVEELDQKDPSS
jgi:hypothetical protein|tara:strand:- start:23 stop:196 length:174 start_codon:yes stop_codon:yes gene_type:complete